MTEPRTSWEDRIDEALGVIRASSSSDVLGCSEQELGEFERKLGLKLPSSYRRFLSGAGRWPGDFMVGSDLRFELLDELQTGGAALVEDDGGPPLPADAFVFLEHHGYQFLCFVIGDDPDPEVLHYLEGTKEFRKVADTFSEWLTGAVQDEFGPTAR